jgi:hypothetical protein
MNTPFSESFNFKPAAVYQCYPTEIPSYKSSLGYVRQIRILDFVKGVGGYVGRKSILFASSSVNVIYSVQNVEDVNPVGMLIT